MTTTRAVRETGTSIRIEPVDNWHLAWPEVVKQFERVGSRRKLLLDRDGWLSSRQIVLVAFVQNKPVGHFCFHIELVGCGSCIRARVDSAAIERGFSGRGIEKRLGDAAIQRAEELRCINRIGFNLGRPWE